MAIRGRECYCRVIRGSEFKKKKNCTVAAGIPLPPAQLETSHRLAALGAGHMTIGIWDRPIMQTGMALDCPARAGRNSLLARLPSFLPVVGFRPGCLGLPGCFGRGRGTPKLWGELPPTPPSFPVVNVSQNTPYVSSVQRTRIHQ